MLRVASANAPAARATGERDVDGTRGSRQIALSDPGSHDTVDVSVKGPDGAAVADADVAVVVVDEAVLSLTGYKLADPISTMYPAQDDERPVDYLRSSLVLANPAVFGRHVATSTPTTSAGNVAAKSTFRAAWASPARRDPRVRRG